VIKLTFQNEYPAKLKYDLEKLGFTLTFDKKDLKNYLFNCTFPDLNPAD